MSSSVTCRACGHATSSDLARCEHCGAAWERLTSSTSATAKPARLLPIWVGFALAVGFLGAEVVGLAPANNWAKAVATLFGLAGGLYWLACIHSFHGVLQDLSAEAHPISPGAAVGYHFVPLYNVYWIFRWPHAISRFVRARGVPMLPGALLGAALLAAAILGRAFDGGLSLICVFTVGAYVANRLRAVTANLEPALPTVVSPLSGAAPSVGPGVAAPHPGRVPTPGPDPEPARQVVPAAVGAESSTRVSETNDRLETAPAITLSRRTCGACDAENADTAAFCGTCGKSLSAAIVAPRTPGQVAFRGGLGESRPASPSPRLRRAAVILAAVITAAVGYITATGGWYDYSYLSDSELQDWRHFGVGSGEGWRPVPEAGERWVYRPRLRPGEFLEELATGGQDALSGLAPGPTAPPTPTPAPARPAVR